MCHDEPRDSAKGMKQDQANTASNSAATVKQEDPLPYMLGPSIDQQQLDRQALQDAGADLTTGTAAPDSQTERAQFQPQTSNSVPQGQVFGDKNQQCEKHITSSYPMIIPTDRKSPRLRRLGSEQSESIFGYA